MGGANDFFAFSGRLPKGHITKYPLLYFGLSKLREEGDGGGAKGVRLVKVGGANFFPFSKDLQKVATLGAPCSVWLQGGQKGRVMSKWADRRFFCIFKGLTKKSQH